MRKPLGGALRLRMLQIAKGLPLASELHAVQDLVSGYAFPRGSLIP
jgi:hypothetical protein